MTWPAEWTLLRPAALWLFAATPLLLWLLRTRQRRRQMSPWDALIAPELRSAVLTHAPTAARRGWLWALGLLLAWVCAVIALAGPSLGQTEVPTVPPTREVIIALGLSPSQRATDLSPDRLTRTRLALEEWLLAQDNGRVGLVSFASRAYRVSPLTEDMPTLRYLLQALSPDLMPGGGHNTLAGLRLAAQMFSTNGGQRDILLVVDQDLRAGTLQLARELASQGIRTNVLSVGTTSGAPIPLANGRFATDGRGELLMATVDESAHQELAAAGQGRWARITDWDTQSWAEFGADRGRASDAQSSRDSTIPRDDGIWLLLPLALWLAWRVGQHSLLMTLMALGLSLLCLPPPAYAAEPDWWANPQRQAVQRWQLAPESVAAEELPLSWAGRALLEQDRPEAAADVLRESNTLTDRYNAALALAKANQLEPALQGFADILREHPEFEPAAHNYRVVEQALEQQRQQEQQQEQDNSGQGSEQQAGNDGQASEDMPPESAEQQQQPGEGEQEQAGQGSQDPATSQESRSAAQEQPPQDPSTEADTQEPGPSQAEAEPRQPDASTVALPSLTDPQGNPEQADEAERQIRQWLKRVDSDPARLLRERFRRLDLRAPADDNESDP
jgi:Ca-activated chloride channel family protein